MVKMAFREKIKLFPNAPGCALSQKNTKKIIPVGHFQGMVEGQAPLWSGNAVSISIGANGVSSLILKPAS